MTLAELAGDRFSTGLISKIERDQVRPSLPTLTYIAERLARPVSFFLDDPARPIEPPAPTPTAAPALERAEALVALGEHEAALALLDEPISHVPPPDPAPAALRALALLELGRLDEAGAVATDLRVPSAPTTPRARLAASRAAYVAGEVARRRGRAAAAHDGLARCLLALDDDPDGLDLRARALRALAALHEERGEPQTARNLYRQADALLAQLANPRQQAARWLRHADELARLAAAAGAATAAARAATLARLADAAALRADVDARLARLALAAGDTPPPGRRYLDAAEGIAARALHRRG